ncbi:MAG: hypothetical protein HZC40_10350 [Chloroflexi bacterium]|nr:hypothetical protein [Chloroflexota bacterium]
MWNYIVAAFAILIAATFVIEKIFYRNKPRTAPRRMVWSRELAALVAFAGVLLIVLSFAEAMRQAALASWLWGIGFGALVAVIALASGVFQTRVSARGAMSVLRAYGIALIIAVVGIYLAMRVIGATFQIFFQGGLSVFALGASIAMFARGQPNSEKPSS